jgi:hypothetical protein
METMQNCEVFPRGVEHHLVRTATIMVIRLARAQVIRSDLIARGLGIRLEGIHVLRADSPILHRNVEQPLGCFRKHCPKRMS